MQPERQMKNQKQYKLAAVMGLLSMCLLCLVGCGKPHAHKFHKGQMVEVILDGRRGQVVHLYKYHGTVGVRVTAQTSFTGFLGGTVGERPYAIVDFAEYEIRPAD